MSVRRKNAELPYSAVVARFDELLHDPQGGSGTLVVAQDLLEENGFTLYGVSLMSSTTWREQGRFHLRGEDTDDPRFVNVAWIVMASTKPDFWNVEVEVAYNNNIFYTYRGHHEDRYRAIRRAVQRAWGDVKVIKAFGLDEDVRTIDDKFDDLRLRRDAPTTPESVLMRNHENEEPASTKVSASLPEPFIVRSPESNPVPSSKAIRMYRGFHQHDPKKVGQFNPDLVIPETCFCVGEAVHVLYRSDKLNPSTGEDEGWIDYIHDHGSGVHVYRCDRAAAAVGVEVRVPAHVRGVSDLTWLGLCQGFAYMTPERREAKAKGTTPYPELYTSPSGKCLYVIQGKRKLLAMIWGGKLGVEPRGIVH